MTSNSGDDASALFRFTLLFSCPTSSLHKNIHLGQGTIWGTGGKLTQASLHHDSSSRTSLRLECRDSCVQGAAGRSPTVADPGGGCGASLHPHPPATRGFSFGASDVECGDWTRLPHLLSNNNNGAGDGSWHETLVREAVHVLSIRSRHQRMTAPGLR